MATAKTPTAPTTVEEARALAEQIAANQAFQSQYELTKLEEAKAYLEGAEVTAVVEKLREMSANHVDGMNGTILSNIAASIDGGRQSVMSRHYSLNMQLNPLPAPELSAPYIPPTPPAPASSE